MGETTLRCGWFKVMVTPQNESRTSLALGWEAAKANAVPGFILQATLLLVLTGYYLSAPFADLLNRLAQFKSEHRLAFLVVRFAFARAIVPEISVIVFFPRR